MGRPTEQATARGAMISVRLTDAERIRLDELRGKRTRSAYVRLLVNQAARPEPDGGKK